jgi:hypothetical protein
MFFLNNTFYFTPQKSSKTLKKPSQNSQKPLKNRNNIRLIPYKILKKLSKTRKNPSKNSQKTLKKSSKLSKTLKNRKNPR